MIFVTVGTHYYNFNRLIMVADELAHDLDEEVVIQYGSSSYIPKYGRGLQWVRGDVISTLIQNSRVVVSHAAAGSILSVLQYNRPLVLVPRLPLFKEVLDDHQLQLAKILGLSGRAIVMYDLSVELLHKALGDAIKLKPAPATTLPLVMALHAQINNWAMETNIQSSKVNI